MSKTANRTLTASLEPVVVIDNPGYSGSILRVDLENKGASAVTGWKLYGQATPNAPLRDITPGSVTAADGYLVITPAPRAPTLAAAANTQLAINCTLWHRMELHFAGAGAQLAASWEVMS